MSDWCRSRDRTVRFGGVSAQFSREAWRPTSNGDTVQADPDGIPSQNQVLSSYTQLQACNKQIRSDRKQ